MANTNIVLPFLSPLAKNIPFVDPKTGMLSTDALRWIIELEQKIFGVWKDVPFDAANFTTDNPAVTWNVIAGNVNQLQYFQAGNFAVIVATIIATTVSADVSSLYVTIPTLRQKADSVLKAFDNTCIAQVLPALTETAAIGVVNVATSVPLRVTFARRDGVLWPVASASISVIGMVIAECVSVVVP